MVQERLDDVVVRAVSFIFDKVVESLLIEIMNIFISLYLAVLASLLFGRSLSST